LNLSGVFPVWTNEKGLLCAMAADLIAAAAAAAAAATAAAAAADFQSLAQDVLID
jgi:hypothetical protein